MALLSRAPRTDTAGSAPAPRILLLDNRDSFVWNLAHALAACGAEVDVRRSDYTSLDEVLAALPDALVVSPGPGRPEDAFVSVDAITALSGRVPVLGVCLGHQAIGTAFGATIARVEPCHGLDWPVRHDGDDLFSGLPSPMRAARYHSLAVLHDPWPDVLVPQAWTDDGAVVMALRHRHHDTFGVQFHPESFLTRHGPTLLAHFVDLAQRSATRP